MTGCPRSYPGDGNTESGAADFRFLPVSWHFDFSGLLMNRLSGMPDFVAGVALGKASFQPRQAIPPLLPSSGTAAGRREYLVTREGDPLRFSVDLRHHTEDVSMGDVTRDPFKGPPGMHLPHRISCSGVGGRGTNRSCQCFSMRRTPARGEPGIGERLNCSVRIQGSLPPVPAPATKITGYGELIRHG
jgi:hypothetical protein